MLFATTPVSQISPLFATLRCVRGRQRKLTPNSQSMVCRHGVKIPLKLSLSQKGQVVEEMCGMLGQPKKSRIVMSIISLIYDIARRSSRAPRLDQDNDGIVSVGCGY